MFDRFLKGKAPRRARPIVELRMDATRVTLVHDWLTGMRGGEKVLEIFCRRWPDAALYTLLHRRGSVCDDIERLHPRTSFLQMLPGVHRYYRYLLPLMPRAVGWKLPECDLVVSSSHCVAKGVTAPAGTPHVCYCYTPMRYAWHMRDAYGWRGVKGWLVDHMLTRLRAWDRKTADGVTNFIAISREVQRRIRECYRRDSVVIYPPVDTDFYTPAKVRREDYYLVVSAFAPYKRIDLAIDACRQLKRRLVVIGTGQDQKRLRAVAGPTVEFLGWQSNEAIREHMRRCQALLFPGVEDFGIVPVEAMACGTPVIAFGQGGATETVIPPHALQPPTGLWFPEQTADSLIASIELFERYRDRFDPSHLRRHAERFAVKRFEAEFFGFVKEVLDRQAKPRQAA
jgi:glycosyltransferase involved in cell wall biosynthesis